MDKFALDEQRAGADDLLRRVGDAEEVVRIAVCRKVGVAGVPCLNQASVSTFFERAGERR